MTEIFYCDDLPKREITLRIINGASIVFPTDTVYGLGSNPRSEEGVRKCITLKGRESGKPMPVLFSSIEPMEELVTINETARLLGDKFWPGALTLVLPLRETVTLAPEVVGGGRTLAVRIPNHRCCLFLIRSCGGSLVGTSANISGGEPATDPDDPKLVEFVKKTDYFIKGECGEAKSPSTVVDATGSAPRILREGAIPGEKLLAYLEKTSNTDFSRRKSTI